jgi:hypothetical protein
MSQEQLAGRGNPWDYDPGPPRNRRWARLFGGTPSPYYYRLSLPRWVFDLPPVPPSDQERDGVERAPVRRG